MLPAGFTEPCNSTVSERPPSGPYWFMKSSTRLPDDRPAQWRAGARLGDIPRNDLARPRRRPSVRHVPRSAADSNDNLFVWQYVGPGTAAACPEAGWRLRSPAPRAAFSATAPKVISTAPSQRLGAPAVPPFDCLSFFFRFVHRASGSGRSWILIAFGRDPLPRVWSNSGISQRCWKTRHFGSQSRLPSRGSWPSPLASREARTKTACRYRAVPPSACARHRSSSRAGDANTTRSGFTPQSDTSHQHQRYLCLHSPRGRLRYADRLRRPRWRNGQP